MLEGARVQLDPANQRGAAVAVGSGRVHDGIAGVAELGKEVVGTRSGAGLGQEEQILGPLGQPAEHGFGSRA